MRQSGRTEQHLKFCERLSHIVDSFCRKKLGDLGKATMKLALGKFQESPFAPSDLEELREDWFKLLPDPARAREVPE